MQVVGEGGEVHGSLHNRKVRGLDVRIDGHHGMEEVSSGVLTGVEDDEELGGLERGEEKIEGG